MTPGRRRLRPGSRRHVVRRRALRPRARLHRRGQPPRGPRDARRGRAARTLDRFTLDLHALRVEKVDRRRRAVAKYTDAARRADRHARASRGRGAASSRSSSPTAATRSRCRKRHWHGRVGGARRRRHRRRPAARRTVLVPVQRPALPTRRPTGSSVTTSSDYHVVANGTLVERRRGASTTTWVYEQAEPMATLPRDRADRPVRRRHDSATATGPDAALVAPAGSSAPARRAFGRQAEMVDFFTPPSARTPSPVRRRGHRGRPRDPARGAGALGLRQRTSWAPTGTPSGSWRTSWPTSGSATA